MEQQLHQKEDMGEVLHVVDFDQLKIDNQQYLDRIEERNTELLRLKATTGKAVQVSCCLHLFTNPKRCNMLAVATDWHKRVDEWNEGRCL